MERVNQLWKKYVVEPTITINMSTEAMVQYITTMAFAFIYYIGLSHTLFLLTMIHSIHKSILQSFPNYIQTWTDIAYKWFPSLVPQNVQKVSDDDFTKVEESHGIPYVPSNPRNIGGEEEKEEEIVEDSSEEFNGNSSEESTEEFTEDSHNDSTEESSASSTFEAGVRPPANSRMDILINELEKLVKSEESENEEDSKQEESIENE